MNFYSTKLLNHPGFEAHAVRGSFFYILLNQVSVQALSAVNDRYS